MKTRFSLFGLLSLVSFARISAAQPALPTTIEAKPQADFEVILAAPSVVTVTRSPVVPISVMVRRKDASKPYPATLTFEASNGLFCKLAARDEGSTPLRRGDLVLDGTQAVNTVLVSLQGNHDLNNFSVSIFSEGKQRVATQEIKVLRPAKVEFEEVSTDIRADGRSTGIIRLRALDQDGSALPDAQFILRDYDPDTNADIAQTAVTDAQGKAFFRLPAATRGQRLLPQLTFISPYHGLRASSQFDIIYRDANNANVKPVVPDPLWWKKGWKIGE